MGLIAKIKKLVIPKHPHKRRVYAVVGGKYLGEILIYISTSADSYNFLIVPHMKNRSIPVEKFQFALTERIVDVIDKLPRYVYNVCKLQYIKNVEDNNIAE
jgi:hypothetical protein